jgi:hypothetical protein
LHVPGQDPLPDFSVGSRQPLEPQAHVIAPAIKMPDETCRGILAAQMVTAKTLMGMLTLHQHAQRSVRKGGCNGNYRAILLCPDHLIKKWQDELEETIPAHHLQPIHAARSLRQIRATASGARRHGGSVRQAPR